VVTKIIDFKQCSKCLEFPSIKVVNIPLSEFTRYRSTCSCRESDLSNVNFHFLEDAALFWNNVCNT
jgi:hypothetical protein